MVHENKHYLLRTPKLVNLEQQPICPELPTCPSLRSPTASRAELPFLGENRWLFSWYLIEAPGKPGLTRPHLCFFPNQPKKDAYVRAALKFLFHQINQKRDGPYVRGRLRVSCASGSPCSFARKRWGSEGTSSALRFSLRVTRAPLQLDDTRGTASTWSKIWGNPWNPKGWWKPSASPFKQPAKGYPSKKEAPNWSLCSDGPRMLGRKQGPTEGLRFDSPRLRGTTSIVAPSSIST